MKRMLVGLTVLFFLSAAPALAEPLDAVLIVQNHAADEFQKPLSNLGDQLAMALSGEMFNIIDPNDAIGDDLNRGPWGENMPISSATRLAENLDAQVLITAAVDEASVVGFGAPARVQEARMKLTLSLKRLPKGATVAAVTVPVAIPKMTPGALSQNADAVYSDLVNQLVEKAAADFLAKCSRIARNNVLPKTIEVAFGCNFPGADVSIDGISYGTAGTIGDAPLRVNVTEGIHNLEISYPYTDSFKKRAKFQEGSTYMVVLRENEEGRRIRKEDRYFDILMDRIEKSGATDDQVRIIRERGYGEYLSSSWTRIEGMPQVLSMRECQPPDLGLHPDREGDGTGTSTSDLIGKAGAALGLPDSSHGGGKGMPEAAPKEERGNGRTSTSDSGNGHEPPDNTDVGVVMPLANQTATRQAAVAPGNTTASYAQPAASYAPAPSATTYTPSATSASSPSEPTVMDTLHEIREGVDTSRDIVQGIKDIGEMLK
jgi:hypothetical protein